MREVSIQELKTNMSRYLGDAAAGADTLVTRNGQPYVVIRAAVPAVHGVARTAQRPQAANTREAVIFIRGDRSRVPCTLQEAERALNLVESQSHKIMGVVLDDGHTISFPADAIDHVLTPFPLGGERRGESRYISLTTLANVRFFIHEDDVDKIRDQIQGGNIIITFPPFDREAQIYGAHVAHVPARCIANFYID